MNFKSAVTCLGSGSVAYARASGDIADVLVRSGGAIKRVRVDLKLKAVEHAGVVSLADECLPTESGRIEKLGEIYYAENG